MGNSLAPGRVDFTVNLVSVSRNGSSYNDIADELGVWILFDAPKGVG